MGYSLQMISIQKKKSIQYHESPIAMPSMSSVAASDVTQATDSNRRRRREKLEAKHSFQESTARMNCRRM